VKIRNPDLSHKDWELCRSYVEDIKHRGFSAYEPWEWELEAWAANPNRQPRKSTVAKLRLRFPIRGDTVFHGIGTGQRGKNAEPLQSLKNSDAPG
jgi:hypothetical protein